MRSAKARRGAAKLVLGMLLFAQAAIGWSACDMPDRSPAQAIAREPAAPCHEEPGLNPNLCLAHCLSPDQSPDTPALPTVPALVAPVLSVAAFLAVASASPAPSRFVLPRPAAPPPPRILFQSFLI